MYLLHKESFETGKLLDIKTLLEITEQEKHYHNFCYHFVKYNLERIIILKKNNLQMFFKHYKAPQKWYLNNYDNVYKTFNKVGVHYKEILKEQYFDSWYHAIKRRLEYSRDRINEVIVFHNKWNKYIVNEYKLHGGLEFPISRIPKNLVEKTILEKEKDKVEKYLFILEKLTSKHEKVKKYFNIDEMLVKYLRKKGRYIKNINLEISKSEIADYKVKLLMSFFKEKSNIWIFIENFSIKLDIIELFMILVKLIFKILG